MRSNFGTLPLVAEMKDRIEKLIKKISSVDFRLPDKEIFDNLKDGDFKSKRKHQLDLIDGLKWLKTDCESHWSIDTYAKKLTIRRGFEIEVDGNVYALDSTTIDLCLSIFWWAEFRKHKGGIKLHTLYDVKTYIPSFLYITNAIVHDVNIMDIIPYETGSFYVADKGYTDFHRLYKIHNNGSFFVTRAKENLRFKRMYFRAVDKTTGVLSDHIGKLEVYKSKNY